MTILAAFVANAGLNFLIGLAVAGLLGPGNFGRYAVAMAVAVVLNTVLFEWLRLCATRFYSERARTEEPGIRATLDLGYAALSVLLAAVLGLGAILKLEIGLPLPLLAAAALAGLGMGLFDYQAALARARFADRVYARLVIVKNTAALVLMVGAAWLGEPALVLAGSALSALAAILGARRTLGDGARRWREAGRAHLSIFAGYALPLVAASIVYQLIPFLNRSTLAATAGFAEAGQFSLAADVGLRLFQAAGSAFDLVLFQIAVRAEESRGRAEAERQISRNLALVAALVLPFAAGFCVILPAFEALVVPAAFRGSFATYSAVLIPALLALSLIQYALNPVFQLSRRTRPVVAAALAALAVNAAALAVLPGVLGPIGVAFAQLAGLATALACLGLAAQRAGLRLPGRDLLTCVLATAIMVAAILPLRNIAPALALPAAVALGALVYATLAYAFDIAGLRGIIRARLRRSDVSPA